MTVTVVQEILKELDKLSALFQRWKTAYFRVAIYKCREIISRNVKGNLYRACREFLLHVRRLSVYTYLAPDSWMRFLLLSALNIKKIKKKKCSYSLTDDKKVRQIFTDSFVLRDFTDNISADKDQKFEEWMIKIRRQLRYEHLGPDPSPVLFISTYFNDLNKWLHANFFGHDFSMTSIGTLSLMSYRLAWAECNHSEPLAMGAFKLSQSTLMSFLNYSQGGLTFNTCRYAATGAPINEEFNHREPVKDFLSYDIRSAYAFSLFKSDMPVGQCFAYDELNHDEMILRSDLCVFEQERNACFYVIYEWTRRSDYVIIATYSSYNHRGQLKFGPFKTDLTVVVETKKKPRQRTAYVYQFHGRYYHGHRGCVFPELKKYKNGWNRERVISESEEKDKTLKNILKTFTETTVCRYELVIKHLCCDFKNVKDYSTGLNYGSLKTFFLNTGEKDLRAIKFQNEIHARKKIKKGDVIKTLASETPLKNLPWANCFVICKLKIPQDGSESNQMGYVVSHFCYECYSNETGKLETESPHRHRKRLVAAHSSQKPALFHVRTLRFLLKEKKAIITRIFHVFLFASDNSCYKSFVGRALKLRELVTRNEMTEISKILKTMINNFIGYLQLKNYKKNEKWKLVSQLNKELCNKKVNKTLTTVEFAETFADINYFFVKYRYKFGTETSFYFRQSFHPLAAVILSESKLLLLKFVDFVEKFTSFKSFKIVYVNTDSALFISSRRVNRLRDAVRKELLEEYDRQYGLFIAQSKNFDSYGKMMLENRSSGRSFVFSSPNSRCYSLTYPGTGSVDTIKGFKKNNCNVYERWKNVGIYEYPIGNEIVKTFNYISQKDRISLHNNSGSRPYP